MSMMNQMNAGPATGGTFVPNEVLGMLGNFGRADADACDFGVVKVDDTGKIVMYNRYQSELGGVAPSHAEGKVFFTQIAPCTNNSLFFGNFKKGVAANNLNVVFPYTFTFKMKPTNVRVHMYRDPNSQTNWVFVARA
ncbi:MAG: photoactive yellow protein [Planctomycetota bacterium]